MKLITAIVLFFLLFCASLRAQNTNVTAAWDANTDGITTGYILKFGTISHQYDSQIDAAGINTTAVVVPGLLIGVKYYFAVLAYNSLGQQGPLSNEINFTPSDPKCAYPLGQNAVVIFPTKLVKTGSGNAGSLSEIYFVVSSPNSPINYLSIRANGIDIPDSIMGPTIPPASLKPTLGSRFTVPPIPVNYSIFATNAYGCQREQTTVFHN